MNIPSRTKLKAERKKLKAWSRIKRVTQKQRKAAKDRKLSDRKHELWNAAMDVDLKPPTCGLCGEPILFFFDADICHESSRGIGGGKRDDTKVFLGHRLGNWRQGGLSLAAYKSGKTLAQLRKLCGVSG